MKIGAIVIHCSDYIERKHYVEKLEKFFENTEVEIKVIDGVITDDIIYDARFEENISLTKGQIGCSLSHINALKLALDMNVDYAFIFEDDVEIVVDTYKTLKNWLDNLPKNYDLCLLTTIGIFVDPGHDGRLHKNIVENGVRYVSCPFGTQAYYASKNIINILYDTQINMLKKNKLYIADGLHIHCEKEKNVFLQIVTPIEENKLFKHSHSVSSIIGKYNICR